MAVRQATATRERPAQQAAPQQAPTGNLPATQDKPHPLTVLKGQLEERQNEFAFVLPDHIPPQRFTRVCLTAVQMNPKLLSCDRASFFNSCLKAAQDGLLPDGREGAIVEYKDNKTQKILAQWMPMYQGILKKVRNSGEFKWMTAQIVYEGDAFDHWIDQEGEHFEHRPAGLSTVIHRVYSAVTTKSGGAFVEVMTPAQIAKVRAVSRVKSEYGPWAKWTEEMSKKTVFRRLSKRLPISSDLDDLIRRDDALYDFDAKREEAQGGGQEQRRLTTTQAFDRFAGAGETIDHDPETGEVNDEDFGGADAGSEDFGTADDREDVLAQEARQREEQAKAAADKAAEAKRLADAKAKEVEAEKARKAEAAKKEDPISSGPQRVGSQEAPPVDDKGAASAGGSGEADRTDPGVDAQDRRWPTGATPSNEDEYEHYAETALADFTDGPKIAPWWKSQPEIDLRKACGVKQETFNRIRDKALNRVAALKKK